MRTTLNIEGTRLKTSQRGFSLLELLISMVVFLVVTASVFGLLQVARQSRTIVSENTSLDKNVRLALNLLGRDTYNAGYGYPLENAVVLPDNRISALLTIPNDIDSTRDIVPPIMAGNDITLSTYNPVANTRTDQVTFLFKDTTFNLDAGGVPQPMSIPAATTVSSIDQIVLATTADYAQCRVRDLFLITGVSGSTLGVVTAKPGSRVLQFANGDLLGFNQTGASGPIRTTTVSGGSIQRVRMVTYYVTPDGILTRREYANSTATAPVDEPLVYGVEDFQVVYIMDDGTNVNNPLAGPNGVAGDGDDTPGNLAAVRQVRFTVSVRSTEKNVANDYYRTSMTSTFSTRNLGYDAN